jgi:phage repressor protein C with HTH and peptisase S24 domain
MEHKTVSVYEIGPIIEEQIKLGNQVKLTVSGNSMEPFFHNQKTIVTLTFVSKSLKKRDIVFYKNINGQYILHRIISLKKGFIVCCGDALKKKEYLPKESIIARVIEFKNGNLITRTNSKKYQFYGFLWWLFYPIRRLLLKIYITKK